MFTSPVLYTCNPYIDKNPPDHTYTPKEWNNFGHISLQTAGNTEEITKGLLSCLEKQNTSLENLVVLGCDGTNINTEWKGGIIQKIEVHIGKPVHWKNLPLESPEPLDE
ncbi:unnamed protein product [Psylliodes chrysocephalus]|uniref:Uncharacterized protein n=1 Tax=Psylliodes chrysocephalus TaxID=3402493 RepID=A0A9P0CN32_9CUCU|nr:unnamed protein product [Psylliodes chrysocephala]